MAPLEREKCAYSLPCSRRCLPPTIYVHILLLVLVIERTKKETTTRAPKITNQNNTMCQFAVVFWPCTAFLFGLGFFSHIHSLHLRQTSFFLPSLWSRLSLPLFFALCLELLAITGPVSFPSFHTNTALRVVYLHVRTQAVASQPAKRIWGRFLSRRAPAECGAFSPFFVLPLPLVDLLVPYLGFQNGFSSFASSFSYSAGERMKCEGFLELCAHFHKRFADLGRNLG